MITSCCKESAEAKFKRECPYKEEYSVAAHQLKVPVQVMPHKLKYKVGDTINFIVNMSDSIFDINTERTFKISNFPFKSLPILYHFYDNNKWKDGWKSVNYLIDTSQFVRYISDGNRADGILVNITKANKYNLHIAVVLKERGKYIFQMQDYINDFRPDSEEYKRTTAIQFDGKCPTFHYWPVNMIVGDDQMSYFEKELLYIDKEEFYDNWWSTKWKEPWKSPYGEGSFFWEYNATFGFEVE
jgi:hypothetical protein